MLALFTKQCHSPMMQMGAVCVRRFDKMLEKWCDLLRVTECAWQADAGS